MANDLNSVLKMPVAQPQVQGLTQMNAQTRAGNGKSFASVMSEIGSNAQAAQTLAANAPLIQDGLGPASSTEQHFEQVLGDSIGIANARALAQVSDFMSSRSDSTFDVARNVLGTRSIISKISGQVVDSDSGLGSHIVRRAITPPQSSTLLTSIKVNPTEAQSKKSVADQADSEFTVTGALSARFESGQGGIAAIGYDTHGGTSYGKYQISSKAGSMTQFIKFLRQEAPALAKRLESAGAADTGSRSGKMPEEWKKIAQEQPDFFRELQERFIHDSHYKPALMALAQKTDLNDDKMSAALQEVLWSTAVQHGPNAAARIFSQAMNKIDPTLADKEGSPEFEQALIENVYAMRSTQFSSSTEQVRTAVKSRLKEEKNLALAMLQHLA